jgi:hypothetical protein
MQGMGGENDEFTIFGTNLFSRLLRIGVFLIGALFLLAIVDPSQHYSPRLLAGWLTFLPKVIPGLRINWGGVAQFFFDQGRLRFTVQLEAARRARLQISSRLLTLAKQR